MSRSNFEGFSVPQLRQFLKVRGFSSKGPKASLLKQCHLYASSPILRPEQSQQGDGDERPSLSQFRELENVLWKPLCQPCVRIPIPTDFDIVEISNYITYNRSVKDEEEEFQAKKTLAKGRQMYCSEKLLSALYHQLEDGSLYVKGSCEASMTSNVTYKPIVKIKTDGAIGDSTCTCKARSDGKCVHVAVLLLMVEDLVQGNEPKMYCPSTSKSQYWGHGSLKRKDPIALHARTYNKKRKPDRYLQHDVLAKTVEKPSQATLKRIFQGLQRESMWDRLLTYGYENYLCSPTRKQELITNVMELMNKLENDAKGFSNDPLSNSFCVHATGTVGQADVPLWMELRKWRVTGSNFKSFTSDNPSVVAKSVWRNQDLPDLRALKWGQDHESVARKEYEETTGDTIVETGLFICKENYVFGYSPDGLIGTDGLLEIKCPFSLRELEFEELADLPAVKKSGLPFTFDQHGVHLRRTHAYFYQVQLGMFVMGRKFADFMV